MFTFFDHSIFITHHSSLITHHSKYQGGLVPSLSFHHSLFFTLFGGPTPVTMQLFFFQYLETRTQWRRKKKKKKPMKTEPSEEERKKKNQWRRPNPMKKKGKKKNQWRPNQWERRRKKKVSWSKGEVEWVPHVCLVIKMLLSYELWKQKIENWVMACQINFFWELRWVSPFLRIELWKLRIEWWELINQTTRL